MQINIGAAAALGTAIAWTFTSLSFEYAAKRIGSLSVNLLRLIVAFFLLGIYGLVVHRSFFPVGVPPEAWLWLSASGLVGFVLGDLALFQAFVDIGSRISMLIYAGAPAIAAVLGYCFLGERMGPISLAGMALTLGGIAFVVMAKGSGAPVSLSGRKTHLRGLALAAVGTVGQAGGLILSKLGAGKMDPFACNEIRVIAGTIGFLVIVAAVGASRGVVSSLRDGKAVTGLCVGSFFGPFLGVSLSVLAVQSTDAGTASAIMSITPVLILAPSAILSKQRVTMREIVGAIVAVAGVALLFAGSP